MGHIIFALTLLFLSQMSWSKSKLALVYDGPGACPEDCALAAAQMAELAGLSVHYVNAQNYSKDLLQDAVIWIQPGGKSTTAAAAMGKEMMNDIKEFIQNGGGYVGFCAGAFISTQEIGTSGKVGFGIIPGKTKLYKTNRAYTSEPMEWMDTEGKMVSRNVYWEGGPILILNSTQQSQVQILSRYKKTNEIGAIKTQFGNGRVAVTGLHPEAPKWWLDSLNVPDTTDWDLAIQMIEWAVKK